MPVDASIPLAVNNSQIDLASIYSDAMQLSQLKQQATSQNALKMIASQPGAIDPTTGSLTANALAQYAKYDPANASTLSLQSGEAAEHAAQVKHTNSETQTDDIARHADELSSAIGVYDAELQGGNTDPAIAETQLKSSIKDYIDAQPWADDRKASAWSTLSAMKPEQLRGVANQLSMTSADRKEQTSLTEERTPATMGGKPVSVDKEDNVYDPNSGEKLRVTAPIIKQEPGFNPQAVEDRGWTVLTDPANKTQFRYNANTGEATTLDRKPYTPSGAQKLGGSNDATFTPEMGGLMAAMAAEGVSLPTGFRSKAQQVELYQGLLDRYPDKSPDEIATDLKTGQIEFGAQKKETQTAAAVAGKVEVAANEIENMIPIVEASSAKFPRGKFVPMNKLLNTVDENISDPDLRDLKVKINSILNAYDLLGARGGTDADKRAATRAMLTSADSPEVLKTALNAMQLEAKVAHESAVEATRVPELDDGGSEKPGASGASGGYNSPAELISALHAGKIKRSEAMKIAKDNGWSQ